MELSNIRRLRKSLGLTQAEVAKQTGVSQSLIAKMESGRTEPTYGNAMRIITFLESRKKKQERTAREYMTTQVSTCNPEEKVNKVIKRMRDKAISQLPVVKDGVMIGMVSESSLLEHVIEDNPEKLLVSQVMEPAPPTVSPDTPESAFTPLLKHYVMIVVTDKGKIEGVVARSDIIRKAYS